MKVPMLMTAGPTTVRENVRMARAMETTNPDIDLQFFDFYKETCSKLGSFLKTKNEVLILAGEGILGLEAACASLTEPGDRVLVIDNGIFGEGFGDFVKMYGGDVVLFSGDRTREIDFHALNEFLERDSNFKYATVVHCDTPYGVLNNVEIICKLLKSKGILTVVDSVAAMGGEKFEVDNWGIDIALGASQKCLSAPPGLTFLSISSDAIAAMDNRKTSIPGFYCNLRIWKDYYEKKWFPYTQPISDIMGLNVAVNNILEDDTIIVRHKIIAQACRNALTKAGLELYIKEGYSNTVTVVKLPADIEEGPLRKIMDKKYNILISGSFGFLKGKVFRIGHMGENAVPKLVMYCLHALQNSLKELGFTCKTDMVQVFLEEIEGNLP